MAQGSQLLNAISINNVLYPVGSIALFVCPEQDNVVNKTAAQYGLSTGIATALNTGMTIHVYFTYTNTAINPTLNLCGLGAKPIYCYGNVPVGSSPETSWQAGSIISLTYTGTAWVMNDYQYGSSLSPLTNTEIYNATTAGWGSAIINANNNTY